MITTVKIKKISENATIPTRGSREAAGYDLYACIDSPVTINPHETVKIGTGIAMELPQGKFGGVFARSGLATKRGIGLANSVSVIDSDYRGELILPMHNYSKQPQTIEPQERIAQLVVIPHINVYFDEVDELSNTARGDGGFGSTGQQ